MSLNSRLLEARTNKGWSLSVASHETGIARSYLYQLESGSSVTSVSKLVALADAYDVTLDWLARGIGSDNSVLAQLERIWMQLSDEDREEVLLYAEYLRFRRKTDKRKAKQPPPTPTANGGV